MALLRNLVSILRQSTYRTRFRVSVLLVSLLLLVLLETYGSSLVAVLSPFSES